MNIANFSDRLGALICEKTRMEFQLNKVCYGIEVLLVLTISLTVILIIGSLLGLFNEVLLTAISFLLMKMIVGGTHLSGFLRCVGFSALIVTGFTWLTSYYHIFSVIPCLVFFMLVGIATIILYAPLTVQVDFYSLNQRRYRRLLALFIFLSAGSSVLLGNLSFTYCFLGFVMAIFNISPLSIKIISLIDKLTKRRCKT